MTKKYEDYLKTDYWKAVAVEVKKRAGYKCQLCNSQHDLCAHHRDYSHRGSELEHLDDLTCLCRRCHNIFHGVVPEQKESPKPKAFRHIEKRKERVGYIVGDIESADKDMPLGDPIILTQELIARCRTNGAFTSATVRAFGLIPGKEQKGWTFRLVGSAMTREKYREALRGRHIYCSRC